METQERAQPEGLWKPRKGPNQRDYGNPGKGPTRGTMEIQERAQPRRLVSGSRFEPGILTSKRDQVKPCPRCSIKFKISIQPKQMSVHSTDSKLGVDRLYSQFDGLDCSETIIYLISLYFCWSPSTVFTVAKGVSARFLHELYNTPPPFFTYSTFYFLGCMYHFCRRIFKLCPRFLNIYPDTFLKGTPFLFLRLYSFLTAFFTNASYWRKLAVAFTYIN
jgi:hypothetical protein